MRYSFKAVLLLFIALALSACAGLRAYQDGNALLAEGQLEQGLSKLEEAVKLEPRNAEYRITLASRRTTIINRLVSNAEAARREGRLVGAQQGYEQALALDANNAMAKQGLNALAQEGRHRAALSEAEALFNKGTKPDQASALDKLRPILIENPSHKEALNLKARIDEARAKEQRTVSKLAATFRKPISLEFRDAPLRSVLEVVSQVAGLSFVYDKEIRSDLRVTIFAKNTTIEDALHLLLVTNQLEQTVLNDNAVLIYPNTPQKLKEYQTLTLRSFYLANADVKAVSNSIKTLLKTKDLVVDERLGIILMRDTPEAIRMAERIVALQDLSDPEVMLEVEILEIKRSRLMELGIQWPGQVSLSPLFPQGATALTLNELRGLNRNTVLADVGRVLINARKEDQDGNILANPRIRVRNKEKAKIQIGDRVPVITNTINGTFSSESVNYVDVGLKLEVEPTIYLDQEVAIKINLEVSNLVREILSKSGTLTYQIGTRGANTVLRLKDGETQILAGLISDEDRSTANKIPLLGELPIAGRFFGSQKDDAQRSEILLSITPRVVRALQRPDLLAAEFDSGTEASVGAQSLRLSTAAPADGSTLGRQPNLPVTSAPVTNVPMTNAPEPAPPGSPASAVPPPNTASAPVAGASQNTTSTGAGGVNLVWQGPAQVKAGESFSLVLRVNSQQALRSLPMLVSFDALALEITGVQEGDFFKQGGAQTSFNQRSEATQGKVFIATGRQGNTNGNDAGASGVGTAFTLNFKALTAQPVARVQLLSAAPDPAPSAAVPLPLEYNVGVVP
jgi:general secretion pathway protein D